MPGLDHREGRLHCDHSPLDEVAARFGTPLYVYSRATLESAYGEYVRVFTPLPHRICYALKANSSGALLRILAGLGAGADIVSGLELQAALRAGFTPERIVFSGVGKSDEELAAGLAADLGVFNVESDEEIERLARLAAARGEVARVTLRVNPDIDARSHPYISTGQRRNKFGIDIERVRTILSRAAELPSIEVSGLQCHIGSQITDLAPLEEAASGLAALSRELLAEGVPLQTIDLGGGLGVDYEGRGVPGPRDLAERIVPILRDLPLTLLLEPGRSLVAAAGTLLTRVLAIKRKREKAFVIVDAGMNDLLRPALYAAYHRIDPVEPRGGSRAAVDVVGPVCESGDFLARDRELEELRAGDLLAVRDVGAYSFVMASNYNLRPRPAEVLIEGAGPRLIRRRETFEDLVATEIDPSDG